MCFCGSAFFATTFLEAGLFVSGLAVEVLVFLDAVVTGVLFAVAFAAVFFQFCFHR